MSKKYSVPLFNYQYFGIALTREKHSRGLELLQGELFGSGAHVPQPQVVINGAAVENLQSTKVSCIY